MAFKRQVRNYDGVQFEELRRKIDGPFNDLHDELSECFYDKKPFREYGILDQRTFDELHALVFHHYTVAFHEANMKQPPDKQYNEAEYNANGQVEHAQAEIKAANGRRRKLTI